MMQQKKTISFEDQKKEYLAELYKPDRSKKGFVDEKIIPLLDEINALPSYVTTSSCSGRILLLSKKEISKKFEVDWPFVSHEKVNSIDVWTSLEETSKKTKNTIWFKMECPILHVLCKDLDSAKRLIHLGNSSGFRYSSIFVIKDERVLVQILSAEQIETIFAMNSEIVVSKEYVDLLCNEANKKLDIVHKKLDKLLENVVNLSS